MSTVVRHLDRYYRWIDPPGGPEPGDKLLVIAARSLLEQLTSTLARSHHGRQLLEQFRSTYDVVIGVQLEGDDPLAAALATLAAALEAYSTEVNLDGCDLLLIDPSMEATHEHGLTDIGRTAVVVAPGVLPRSAVESLGPRFHLVATLSTPDGIGFDGVRNLPLPPHDLDAAGLLGLRPVATAIQAWLTEAPLVTEMADQASLAWWEDDLFIVPLQTDAQSALVAAHNGDFDWILVCRPDESGMSYVVLTYEELERSTDRLLLQEGPRFTVGRTVADHPGTPVYDLGPGQLRPAWLDPTPADPIGRRVVVDNDRPVGVVPGRRDVEADRRLMAAPAPQRQPRLRSTVLSSNTLSPNTYHLQYLKATADAVLRPRQSTEVEVEISGFAPQSSKPDQAFVSSSFLVSAGHLTCLVSTRGPLQVEGPHSGIVPVQAPNASARLTFEVLAQSVGAGSITVELLQGAEVVATAQLPLTVTDRGDPTRHTIAATGSAVERPRRRNQLSVYRNGHDGKRGTELRLILAIPDAGDDNIPGNVMVSRGLDQVVLDVLDLLGRLNLRRLDHTTMQSAEISGLGSMLTEHLLPIEFRRIMADYVDELRGIEIFTDIHLIPWELCQISSARADDKGHFLGDLGLTRRLRAPAVRRLHVGTGRRYVSAPAYHQLPGWTLARTADEAKLLIDHFGFKPGPTNCGPLLELLTSGEYDLFHFSGHGIGETEPGRLSASRLILDDSQASEGKDPDGLTVHSMHNLGRRTRYGHPLVFLNACEAGRQVGLLTGFPATLRQAGAGAVIGAQWAVADGHAVKFAETFYSALIDRKYTLSEAMTEARRAITRDSPTRLAYVAYGDPDAKLELV